MITAQAYGRIGRDAETKTTNGGTKVTQFSLATDKGYGDKKKTLWLDCKIWGDRGEKVAGMLKKGTKLVISGEPDIRAFTKKDGTTEAVIEINVRDFTFAGSKKDDGGGYQERQKPAPASNTSYGDMPDDEIPF